MIDSKYSCGIAMKSLEKKKLISLTEEELDLTEAGRLQRKVLVLIGMIVEKPEGGHIDKKSK